MKKYTWAEKDSDQWTAGNFDTIEAALADAVRFAIDGAQCGERIGFTAVVWDLRPATHHDRDMWEFSEEVDVEEPNWWGGCWVPENIVWEGTVSPAGWVKKEADSEEGLAKESK